MDSNINLTMRRTKLDTIKVDKETVEKLIHRQPSTAALVTKLVEPNKMHLQRSRREKNQLRSTYVKTTAESIVRDGRTNDNITRMFPDVKLAVKIYVNSVMAPKDLTSSEVLYSLKHNDLPVGTTGKLMKIISRHFTDHYEIEEMLPEILYELISGKGAKFYAVIPENVLDDIIRNAMNTENDKDFNPDQRRMVKNKINHLSRTNLPTKGILSQPLQTRASVESDRNNREFLTSVDHSNKSISDLPFVEITDNYDVLGLPALMKKERETTLRANTESAFSREHLFRHVKGRQYDRSEFVDGGELNLLEVGLPENATRSSIDRPLIIDFPPESVRSVFPPGKPEKPVGHYVMLNFYGYPVALTSDVERSIGNRLTNTTAGQTLIDKAHMNLVGTSCTKNDINTAVQVYEETVDSELLKQLSGNIPEHELELGDNGDYYYMLLARVLEGKYTRLLYIPNELGTYFALDYHESGVGKSVFSELHLLAAMRASLLFSKVLGETKSNIGTNRIVAKLDPDSVDIDGDMEIVKNVIAENNEFSNLITLGDPADISEWLHRVGNEVVFTGHNDLPDMTFESSKVFPDNRAPDNTLMADITKQMFQGIGVTPESVDGAYSSEFASVEEAKRTMTTKDIMQTQKKLMRHTTAFARIVLKNDVVMLGELYRVLEEDHDHLMDTISDVDLRVLKEDPHRYYMSALMRVGINLVLELPKPDTASQAALSELYTAHKEDLELVLPAWISEFMLDSELLPGMGDKYEALMETYRGRFLRKWCMDNNYMTELSDIVNTASDQSPLINITAEMEQHMTGLLKSSSEYIASLKPMLKKAIKVMEDAEPKEEEK